MLPLLLPQAVFLPLEILFMIRSLCCQLKAGSNRKDLLQAHQIQGHTDYKEFFSSLLCAAAAATKSLQSHLTLCDPIDSSPPGSPVPGILQARTLEWVAISFSNA